MQDAHRFLRTSFGEVEPELDATMTRAYQRGSAARRAGRRGQLNTSFSTALIGPSTEVDALSYTDENLGCRCFCAAAAGR